MTNLASACEWDGHRSAIDEAGFCPVCDEGDAPEICEYCGGLNGSHAKRCEKPEFDSREEYLEEMRTQRWEMEREDGIR